MKKTLIKGAVVVSVDPAIGNLLSGDVLIEGERIVQVAPSIEAADAEVISGADRIVMPGIINAHMHTWQTALRGISANWTLLEYFKWMHRGLATAFTPEDIHIATLAGAVGQINAGVTTLVDWCHNNPTAAHTDAAVDGLLSSGIRGAFFHGSPKPDPKPGQPHFSEVPHPRHEIERLLKTRFGSRDGLYTLGMAILGPHYSTHHVALNDFRLAKEFGLVASMHQGGGPAKQPGGWDLIEREGLLGPWVNIVHGNDLSDAQLGRFVDAGVTFSVTPENEMAQGHGFPITGRVLGFGGRLSMGVDIESLVSTDMFTVARMGLACQRALDNAASRQATGAIPDDMKVTTKDALSWITIEGARMLGMADRLGSLTPGKQADITILRTSDLNLWPVNDPVNAIVTQAGLSNVESVIIAGEFKKRDGKLLVGDQPKLRRELSASASRILTSIGLHQAA